MKLHTEEPKWFKQESSSSRKESIINSYMKLTTIATSFLLKENLMRSQILQS